LQELQKEKAIDKDMMRISDEEYYNKRMSEPSPQEKMEIMREQSRKLHPFFNIKSFIGSSSFSNR